MIFRSLFAVVAATGLMIAGSASAQVLFCPKPVELSADQDENRAKAEKLLERLLIALDLFGHDGIDQEAIVSAHTETPGALLAKLGNVADRCSLATMSDSREFYEYLPALRRTFLEATLIKQTAAEEDGKSDGTDGDVVKAAHVERSIDLSLRDLWRKLWFRPDPSKDEQEHRWAVIVASPDDDDDGWSLLREHQTAWKDVYFQLHQPYYDDNRHHAIVVGKKLPREEAERLRDYVKELGMADDSYVWPVPDEDPVNVASSPAPDVEETVKEVQAAEKKREGLDLSILNN